MKSSTPHQVGKQTIRMIKNLRNGHFIPIEKAFLEGKMEIAVAQGCALLVHLLSALALTSLALGKTKKEVGDLINKLLTNVDKDITKTVLNFKEKE